MDIEKYPPADREAPIKNWGDLIGPVMRRHNVPEASRQDQGLIVLTTQQGTEVCPTFQFDQDDQGKTRLNPHIASAWGIVSALHVDQLGESPWSKAGMLAQPRSEYHNQSWADVLKDPNRSEQDKMVIIWDIVEDAVFSAAHDGIQLTDPRTILPS